MLGVRIHFGSTPSRSLEPYWYSSSSGVSLLRQPMAVWKPFSNFTIPAPTPVPRPVSRLMP